MEITTWEDLEAKIASMTTEQKRQPVQCLKPTANEGDVQEMLQGIAIATVEELGFYKCRSTHDNKYHADDAVLLLDANPYDPDGAIGYDWGCENESPIYGDGGQTSIECQCSPQALSDMRSEKT